MPAHWHSLKNGMVLTMSSTLWLCGAGRTKVRSALCASHRPGRTCRSREGPPVTSTDAAPAYWSTSAKDTAHWTRPEPPPEEAEAMVTGSYPGSDAILERK